jgi:site-specific DNA-methyltransferase (adenine-specific)
LAADIEKNFTKVTNGQAANPHAAMARGFMGTKWDGGDIAFNLETWAKVYRVLKPGAHLLAFGGTRTYHRLVCAIDDAGFEIRDCIQWLYGSGFPKSHDVSKGIDRNHHAGKMGWFGDWLRTERRRIGMSQKELAERGGFYDKVNHGGLVANWELGYGLPSASDFKLVCEIFGAPFTHIGELKRDIVGKRKVNAGVAFTSDGPTELDITVPATDAARQWEGWGTALKPAAEMVVLARKPLSEPTVAANVLKWGTGALNIDACRVGAESLAYKSRGMKALVEQHFAHGDRPYKAGLPNRDEPEKSVNGRWPANVIHDGSEEVVAGAFPNVTSHGGGTSTHGFWSDGANGWQQKQPPGDSGSAARFFYTAKADADDRLGSRHPTVKPIDLMQYLIRLITPKGGVVLDLFAGTGTVGEAAFYEGASAILIEREAEYQADVRRRMELVLTSSDERTRQAAKHRMKDKPLDAGPLFGGAQ